MEVFLAGVSQRFDRRDRSLLEELVYGTLRWLLRLDQVIQSASHRQLGEIDPKLIGILRVATYQLLFLDRVPAHAAVHEAVEQARRLTHKGGVSFVNAVLRRIAREPRLEDWPVQKGDLVERLAIESSHPRFLVRSWLEEFGESRTREIVAANNRPKPLHILAFQQKGGREVLAETLIDEGLMVDPSAVSPQGLVVRKGNLIKTEAFRRGDFYIQDEISQIVALLATPQEGERILDLAAAPGGKAFSLRARFPESRLLASDLSLKRLAIMSKNCQRLGLSLPLVVSDGGQPAWRQHCFDRIFLDLPCTGTGTLRKNPEIKWNLKSTDSGRMGREALRLLSGAAELLRAGGRLIAITCSIEPEENDRVVDRFLEANSNFVREPWTDLPPEWESMNCGQGKWQCLPAHDHDGFTVHQLRKS